MESNDNSNADNEKEKDEKKKEDTTIYDTLDIIYEGIKSTKKGARFMVDGKIINQDNNLPEVEDDSVLDTISQTLCSAKDAIVDNDIVENVSNVASDVVSGIGEVLSGVIENIDL